MPPNESKSFTGAFAYDSSDPSWVVIAGQHDDQPYNVQYFQNMMDSLEKKIKPTLPGLDQHASFKDACQTAASISDAKVKTEKLVDQLSKDDPVDQDALSQAKELLSSQVEALTSAIDICQHIGRSVLAQKEIQTILSDEYDDKDFTTYVILKQAGAQGLADFCKRGEAQKTQLKAFLSNTDLQKEFLASGGARKGEYGNAIELYNRITSMQQNNGNAVLSRLAMAVSLELASPLVRFQTKSQYIDPIHRYVHYEQAFLFGELDPAFESFSVWELRGVVNCDATDEELGWGRQSLMNFRPNLVTMDDPQWRYCYVIHTDVYYQQPVWYKTPHTYDQILAGGGECGPRAWYGRFICKAFGIPTWGVKQPGHAAMTRWTSKGWMTCLGAGFDRSWWENRGGVDFHLETQAREALACDPEYLQKVMRLEWAGYLLNEDASSILRDCVPNPASLWSSLGLVQRKCIVEDSPSSPALASLTVDNSSVYHNKIQTALKTPNVRDDTRIEFSYKGEKKIIIPAGSPTTPTEESKEILWPNSFLGGRQLILGRKSTVTYDLSTDMIPDDSTKYALTLRLCTVHLNDDPLSITITCESDKNHVANETTASVEVPFTMGMWQETKPVIIEIVGGSTTNAKITVFRPTEKYAIAIKDLKLVPVSRPVIQPRYNNM